MAATPVRITAQSFPTPDVLKTTNNPALWDQLGGFAVLQADAANQALALLDRRLETASTTQARVAAFEEAYKLVGRWRHRVAVGGHWSRPGADPEDFRRPIGDGSMGYRLAPSAAEKGSPAHKTFAEYERLAHDRFTGPEQRLQNVVTLPDGNQVNGNQLLRGLAVTFAFQQSPDEVMTRTAGQDDREVLRRAAFEALAGLETRRAETGGLDPDDPRNRRAYADAAYFLFQAPEVERGTDATMRAFLVAAHARVFQVAPVLPQAIDLDAAVRGQFGFHAVLYNDLRLVNRERTATVFGARAGAAHRDGRRARTGHER